MNNSNDIVQKLQALSLGEKLIGGGGILMFIASIFHWVTVKVSGGGLFAGAAASRSGWGAPGSLWSILAILISLALVAVVACRALDVHLPPLPQGLTWGLVFGGGAAAVVVLMILKAWRISAINLGGCTTCSKSFGLGFFIAVIATIAIAAGGYLMYSEEKGSGGFGSFRR